MLDVSSYGPLCSSILFCVCARQLVYRIEISLLKELIYYAFLFLLPDLRKTYKTNYDVIPHDKSVAQWPYNRKVCLDAWPV